MMCVFMLSGIMLNVANNPFVVMLSVFMLIVMASFGPSFQHKLYILIINSFETVKQ